jgi:CRISPR/Cas system-associated exonuclease Cas4 (RecB family)
MGVSMTIKRVAKSLMKDATTPIPKKTRGKAPDPTATAIAVGLKSASYSRLLDFESCALKAKMKHVDRIPEEKAPAAERGTAIHQMAEDYVRGKLKILPIELKKFSDEFLALRTRFEEGSVSLEGDWGFDKDWNRAEWKLAWMRIKLDARVQVSPTHSIVIDYKTGKRFGNEIKHGEQVVLYGLAEILREPLVEKVTIELWYTDIDDMVPLTYTREQLLRFLPQFEKRLKKMTSATEFPPNPNVFSCKWCAYGPNKGKQCQYGVLPGDTAISIYRRKYG